MDDGPPDQRRYGSIFGCAVGPGKDLSPCLRFLVCIMVVAYEVEVEDLTLNFPVSG